jgi:hypothetical protein
MKTPYEIAYAIVAELRTTGMMENELEARISDAIAAYEAE